MNVRLATLLDKKGPIKRVGVVGMGYVGIPSAMLFANAYDFVWGFQRDSGSSGYKIEMLNRGECPLKGKEPGLDDLIRKVVGENKFRCTSDLSKISGVDAVTLAIQTPFLNARSLEPDFSSLAEGLKLVGRHITEGTLVVLESTVTPGTTDGFARQILEKESGMTAGEDFALAHAPERVMVGRLLRNIQEHDRIVGGIDQASSTRAVELYSRILVSGKPIPMTATAAEITKTAENAFRDLQIAAINQLALYCESIGVNVYDVREGIASLKGEGVTRAILYPGAGVGGHCLTKDTYHLERGLKTLGGQVDYPYGKDSLFVLARNINDFMPRHMFRMTVEGIKRADKEISRSTVAILGWAFINNSDDCRNTPSEAYRDLLLRAGAKVKVHDPYVKGNGLSWISDNLAEVVRGSDAIAIMTGHDEYYELEPTTVRELSGQEYPVIIDGRNVIDPDKFIGGGFIYKGIGRGDKNQHPLALLKPLTT